MNANAAIVYHPEGYGTQRQKLMGRHAAGEGFLRGFLKFADVDRFYAHAESEKHFHQFAAAVAEFGRGKPAHWLPQSAPQRLEEAGALFFPGPGLGDQAWKRRGHGGAGYSLTGVTHTICTHRVMDSIGELLTAPVQAWDALICTSPAVRQGVENVIAGYSTYLAERFGIAPPATPVPSPR